MKRLGNAVVAGVVLGVLGAAAPAFATEPALEDTGETIKVYWELPEGKTGDSPWNSIWDQRHLGTSIEGITCGFTAQWDIYRYGTVEERSAVDALWDDQKLSLLPDGN